MKVRLYRNLSPQYRKRRAWSILAMEGPQKGRVVAIVDGAAIRDADFVVSEAGRQRVIRDRAKNVHAFVQGKLVKSWPLDTLPKGVTGDDLSKGVDVRIGYDPYRTPKMVREDCMQFVEHSPLVVAAPEGVYAKLGACRAGAPGLEGFEVFDVDGWNG